MEAKKTGSASGGGPSVWGYFAHICVIGVSIAIPANTGKAPDKLNGE